MKAQNEFKKETERHYVLDARYLCAIVLLIYITIIVVLV